jgi:GR25 family glycosyltransferase involved in LPS biosynthesis
MKLDQIFELGYLINLKERADRWELCDNEFYKINYYPVRFEGVKHDVGRIGCFLSHLEILKQAQKENKNVLIMEDDVEFDEDCRQVLEASLDELCGMQWDMAYFGGNILRPFFQIKKHWARLSHCQSTHCYSIQKNFLTTVINFLENNSAQKTGLAIDQLYADYLIPNCKAYIIVPMIARQRSDFSTIENCQMTYDLPVQRYWHYLVKNEKL